MKFFWLGLAFPAFLLLFQRFAPEQWTRAQTLNTISAVLNLGGLGLVAYGYGELRHHFGRKSPKEAFRDFFRDFWKAFNPQPIKAFAGSGTIRVGALVSNARLKVTSGPTQPTEARLETLELGFSNLFDEVGSIQAKTQGQIDSLRESIASQGQALDARIAHHGKQLEDVTIGGLGIEVVGWLWLVTGTVIGLVASFA
jgi:hypothetical protein